MKRAWFLAATCGLWSACEPLPDSDTGPQTTRTLFGGDDTGTETDTDPETPPDTETALDPNGLYFDDDHVLVVPDGEGVKFVANDGTVTSSALWSGLVGPCATCGGEGASPDDDGGLLLTFTLANDFGPGGLARLRGGTGELDFRLDGFGFPHGAWRDPLDGTIVVQETTTNRLTWIGGDGSSSTPVRTLNAASSPDWPGNTPNGLDRFQYQGGTYLLSTHRGSFAMGGEITMWDIRTTTPVLVWRFPEEGAFLDTPHCPRLRWYDGQWWLVWAHTGGGPSGGSIGIASAADPLVMPTYVADLVLTDPIGTLDFVRGVELTTDGTLYVTDSGGTGGPGGPTNGRLIEASLAGDLTPAGASGDVGVDQVFVSLSDGEILVDELDNPFEGWLWEATFSLP